jgi:capsular polysaccharide biosynthesis protein
MEFLDFIKLIKKKKGTFLTITFFAVMLTLLVSLINPLNYEAKSRLLLIQNSGDSDPYILSRSNEYLSGLLAEVVHSGSFFDLVLASPYDIDKNHFSGNYNKQLKKWNETVNTKTYSDTGIIEINIYHTSPYQAQQIALAVNNILITNNASYQSGNTVKINIIDQPLVSTYPVQPNLIMNSGLAVIGGLLFSLFYVYLFPEERYDFKLWSSKKTKKAKRLGGAINLENYDAEQMSPMEGNMEGIEEDGTKK